MAAISAQQAYNEIKAHIDEEGSSYSHWYCGITSNIPQRLFVEHKVPEKDHWRIHRECYDDADARSVESTLVNLGCDGGGGGGDETSVYVYAYLKTSITDP